MLGVYKDSWKTAARSYTNQQAAKFPCPIRRCTTFYAPNFNLQIQRWLLKIVSSSLICIDGGLAQERMDHHVPSSPFLEYHVCTLHTWYF